MVWILNQALRSKWAPLSFELSEVFIISRSGHDDPFVSRFSIPLGGHGHPRKVDIPYVATVGGPPSCAADQPLVSRLPSPLRALGGCYPRCSLPTPELMRRLAAPRLLQSASGGLDAAGMELCRVDSPAGGVWNFAYGANINKAKLMEVIGMATWQTTDSPPKLGAETPSVPLLLVSQGASHRWNPFRRG